MEIKAKIKGVGLCLIMPIGACLRNGACSPAVVPPEEPVCRPQWLQGISAWEEREVGVFEGDPSSSD